MCVQVRRPAFLEEQLEAEVNAETVTADQDTTMEEPPILLPPSTSTAADSSAPAVVISPLQVRQSSQAPSQAAQPAKHATVSWEQLIHLRSPLLHLPDTATTVSLSQLPLDKVLGPDASERTNTELIGGLLPDIPFYEMSSVPPAGDPSRIDRRFDESSAHYNRITHVSKWFDSKPFLVSTLNPAKKLKLDNTWGDLADIGVGDDPREFDLRPDAASFGPSKSSHYDCATKVDRPLQISSMVDVLKI